MFCDDTSGNTSKKWNKHNSLLFTLAGLPHDFIHLLYNIHFLATSNIASPLEMFEVLVDKLRCVHLSPSCNPRLTRFAEKFAKKEGLKRMTASTTKLCCSFPGSWA